LLWSKVRIRRIR